MQTWLIFALSYAFLHALVAVLDRQTMKSYRIDPLVLSTVRYGINAVLAYALVLAFAIPVPAIDISLVSISALYFLAGITYFYAIKSDEVSKLIPYRDAIIVLLSFFLAVALLSEKFALLDFFAALVIAIGGYVVWTDGKIIVPKISFSLALIAASAVFLSLNGIAVKRAVASANPLAVSFFMYSLVALYFVIIMLASKRKDAIETVRMMISKGKLSLLILSASFAAVMGVALQFYALSMENAAKVLPVSGTLPLFAALIGWLALKEKHGIARVIGAILILIGIYILSVG